MKSVVNFVLLHSFCTQLLLKMIKLIRQLLWLSWLFIPCFSFAAERSDILLRIGGQTVAKQEFEFYCKHSLAGKCQTESVNEAFDDFLFRKLKAADMRQSGCDTLPAFRQYCKVMRGELLKNVLLDKEQEERICRDLYRQSVERLSKSGWVKIEQITILLSQHAPKADERAARNRMDSIYAKLKSGADFTSFSCQPEGETWIPVVELLQEFADRLASLSKNEFSEPFFSPLGVHIIRLTDTKPCISYEEARPYLLAYMERFGSDHPALKHDLFTQWREGALHNDAIRLCMTDAEDKLLASFWDKLHSSSLPREATPQELEQFFLQNKKHYTWEFPHFRGAVIQCANKKTASRIKKYLKKQPFAQWEESFRNLVKADSTMNATMEVGLFQIGKNAYVDKLAFKCGSLPKEKKYPYICVFGKKLKKGPEEYSDVREEVEIDYRREQERGLLTSLMQHFGVEIEQDVLKTVNCCGSN